MNRYGCAALGGGMLGSAMAVQTLARGEGVGMALFGFAFCIMMAVGGVQWVTEKLNGGSEDVRQSPDQQIDKLHRDLRKAISAANLAESQGRRESAVYWRAEAAVIESELRRRGA